jgi:hypothetical protein
MCPRAVAEVRVSGDLNLNKCGRKSSRSNVTFNERGPALAVLCVYACPGGGITQQLRELVCGRIGFAT